MPKTPANPSLARSRIALAVIAAVPGSAIFLGSRPAIAVCTPASANNVTATCSGTTINQRAGAPGTTSSSFGYGSGNETGITVNVAAGAINTVTGTFVGIYIGDGTVTNNVGASINGADFGIEANGSGVNSGFVNVTNFGSITGTNGGGIAAQNNVTVTNNISGGITGGGAGIFSGEGAINVTNSGSIVGGTTAGGTGYGIYAGTSATVTNTAGGSITGTQIGVLADNGFADVVNSGSITAVEAIVAATNVTVTNNANGTIIGTEYGIYATTGGSSIFNAGTISGGSAAIFFGGSGNILTLAPGSTITGSVIGAGTDTLQLGGSGTGTFDVSQIGAAMQYQGFGSFNKIGDSTWTLTGTNTAPAWTVQQGTLDVSGTIGAVTVTGGKLSGAGTIGDTLIGSGGTFAPGAANTPGSSTTVTGNLAFQSGALYFVQANSATSSFANVSGTATLAGNVLVAFAPGAYAVKQYTILTSAGLGGTTFAALGVTGLPAGFATSLSYTNTSVLLNMNAVLGSGGLFGNQLNVANSINNFFNRGGALPPNFLTVFGLTGVNLQVALTQLSGEVATGSQQTTFNAMTQFMDIMTDPFITGRGTRLSASGAATSYVEEGNAYAAKRDPKDALAAIYRQSAPKQPSVPFEPSWSSWVAAFGGSQATDGLSSQGSNNTTSRIYGTAVGADYRFSPSMIFGFSMAGGGTNFSVNQSGSGRSDLFQAGMFVRQNFGPAYVISALAYGWQDITTTHTVTAAGFDQLQARFNANAFSCRVEGGYRFAASWVDGLGVTPYAAGQFAAFDLPAYAESSVVAANNFALSYGAKSVHDPRTELGVRTEKLYITGNGILTLSGRTAWIHDFDTDRSIAPIFEALPGASFVINGARQASDSALYTASAEFKWMNGWSTAATFEGGYSKIATSYAGKGVVRHAW